MTDTERRMALCDKLHRKGFIVAGEEIRKMTNEIDKLTKEVEFWKAKAEQSLDMLTAYQLSKADHR